MEDDLSERLRKKLDQVHLVADSHLSPVHRYINFTLQQAYFKCAYECFDSRRNQEEINNCVENCSFPVVSAQYHLEDEMVKFQERLKRSFTVCQDSFEIARLEKIKTEAMNDLELCLNKSTDDAIKMLPDLVSRLTNSFSITD